MALRPGVFECAGRGVFDEAQARPSRSSSRSDPPLTEDEVARHCHDQLTGWPAPGK